MSGVWGEEIFWPWKPLLFSRVMVSELYRTSLGLGFSSLKRGTEHFNFLGCYGEQIRYIYEAIS